MFLELRIFVMIIARVNGIWKIKMVKTDLIPFTQFRVGEIIWANDDFGGFLPWSLFRTVRTRGPSGVKVYLDMDMGA